MLIWLIPLLFGLSFAGLGYLLVRALTAGAEAYSGAYAEDTARQFEDIFLFIPPKRIAEVAWAAAGTFFVITFFLTGGPTSLQGVAIGSFFGLVVGGLALMAPRYLLQFLKRRRLTRFNVQLGDVLVNMSNALKAGFSITQAFESVVRDGENPIAQEFSVFLQQTRVGMSFSDALASLEKRVNSEDLTLVVAAIETARKTGGNLTEIFAQISATIRERLRIERRIRTLTAQQRLQGIVVGFMPVIIISALMVVDPGMMIPFLHSTIGLAIIAVVTVLILCGALVIRKIIRIDV